MLRALKCVIAGLWALALVTCQNATPQNKVYGTVDGKPIPDLVFSDYRAGATDHFRISHNREPATAADEQEIEQTMKKDLCGRIRGAISSIAREEQEDRLGVVVTEQDLAEERLNTQMPDLRKIRQHAEAALAAFAALDKGDDSKRVYEQMIKPHGIDETEWNLYLMKRKTQGGRAQIQMELKMTDNAQFKTAALKSLTYAARSKKLDRVVEDQIATTDPTFREYLNDYRQQTNGPGHHQWTMQMDHLKYLNQARAKWWKDRMAQVKVVLSDPSLAQTCAVSNTAMPIANIP